MAIRVLVGKLILVLIHVKSDLPILCLAKKWNTTVGFYTDWCAHPDMGQSSPSPPDLFIYGGGSYLDANTKYVSNYFPHQHTINCDTDLLQPTKKIIYL